MARFQLQRLAQEGRERLASPSSRRPAGGFLERSGSLDSEWNWKVPLESPIPFCLSDVLFGT